MRATGILGERRPRVHSTVLAPPSRQFVRDDIHSLIRCAALHQNFEASQVWTSRVRWRIRE